MPSLPDYSTDALEITSVVDTCYPLSLVIILRYSPECVEVEFCEVELPLYPNYSRR
jgi:hypothetical protein